MASSRASAPYLYYLSAWRPWYPLVTDSKLSPLLCVHRISRPEATPNVPSPMACGTTKQAWPVSVSRCTSFVILTVVVKTVKKSVCLSSPPPPLSPPLSLSLFPPPPPLSLSLFFFLSSFKKKIATFDQTQHCLVNKVYPIMNKNPLYKDRYLSNHH